MIQMLKNQLRRVAYSIPLLRLVRTLDRYMDNSFRWRGMITQALELTQFTGVQGDYFEFGLYRGKTFLHTYRMTRVLGINRMHLWGFDSFAGLPAVTDEEGEIWSEGQFSCSEQDFRSILFANRVDPAAYTLVAGFYSQSLNADLRERMAGRKAAVIYVDCDLYASTVLVLDFVRPYIQNGTVLCFDDYYCYAASPNQGEQRAIKEFLARNPSVHFSRFLTYAPAGQSFIAHLIPQAEMDS